MTQPTVPSNRRRQRRAQSAKAWLQQPRNIMLAMEYYVRGVHHGLVRFAKEAGWTIDGSMMHTHHLNPDWEGDGIIAQINSEKMARALEEYGVPIVAVASPPPVKVERATVRMDDHKAGRLAAEHLLERGFRRFVYYQLISAPVLDGRGEGFSHAIAEAGGLITRLNWSTVSESRGGQGRVRWLAEELAKIKTPFGVMASSDQWAIEVLNACRIADLGVPDQVAVIGVDSDSLYVDVAPVPLSSVETNLQEVGYQAGLTMQRVLDGKKPAKAAQLIEPTGVATRRSTDIIAVDDPYVARAMAFIFQHYSEPINVADVATSAGLSLRRLQSRFKNLIGVTIVQELTRVRMEHVLRLLRETDQTIEQIAVQCGFATGKYMGKVFTRQMEQSPRDYRKQFREVD